MLRSAFLRSARVASVRPAMAMAAKPMNMRINFIRAYSSENGLNRDGVEKRIIDVLKSFEKVWLL